MTKIEIFLNDEKIGEIYLYAVPAEGDYLAYRPLGKHEILYLKITRRLWAIKQEMGPVDSGTTISFVRLFVEIVADDHFLLV
jgi:hypothetical protein